MNYKAPGKMQFHCYWLAAFFSEDVGHISFQKTLDTYGPCFVIMLCEPSWCPLLKKTAHGSTRTGN